MSSYDLPSDVPVLIAGAGPTGLTLALALQVRGVQSLVCEAAEQPARESSRATAVHAGSLELMDRIGLAARLAERGVRTTRSVVYRGTRLLVEQDWTRLPSRYAFLLNLPQAELEASLRDELTRLGGTVRFGCSVVGHQAQEDSVAVDLDAAGTAQTVRCSVLVGCDGAHSAVRRGLGLALEGETYPDIFALADVVATVDAAPDCSILGGSADGLIGLQPLPDGRYRINATLGPQGSAEAIDFELLAQQRLPVHKVQISKVDWTSTYLVHRRSATSMFRGRVLLAGDAAHLSSPIGGQGMNRGIRDAFDLSWRLARIFDDHVSWRILSDWEQLRLQEAARVLEGTHRLMSMLRGQARGATLLRKALPLISRLPPLHDKMNLNMAGLSDARRIIANSEQGSM